MGDFVVSVLKGRCAAALAALAIGLLVLGLYGPFVGSPPIFDDLFFFVDPRGYAGNLSWASLLQSRWVWRGSLELSYRLWGVNPVAYHAGNLLLHAATAFSLFLLLRQLLARALGDAANLPAFAAAALFALHPVSVFAVGYIAQRSVVLAGLFSIWMWIAVHRGVAGESKSWLLASAAFYFLAVFSKEHAVTALPVAVLIAWNASGGGMRKTLSTLALPLPLWGAIALFIVLVMKGAIGGAYESLLLETGASHPQPSDFLLRSYANQCWLFFKYMVFWLWPNASWMAIDMREPFPPSWYAWPWLSGLLAFLAWPALTLVALWRGWINRTAGIALIGPWLLFLTMFAAVLYQEPFVLYRSYLWALPGAMLVAVLLAKAPPAGQIIALTIAGAIYFGLSWNRLQIFSDPVALWNESVQRLDGRDDLPFVFRMYHNRGVAYANREGNANLALAIADYSKALALNPAQAEVFSDRGVAHFYLGNYAQARLDFNSALALKPRYPMAQRGRGLSLLKLGEREKGLADLAATCFEYQFGCDLYQAELARTVLPR